MGGRIDYTDRKTDERMDVQPVACAERWMDNWIRAIIWLNVRAISRQVLYTLRPIHPLALSDDSYTFCHNEAD